MVQTLLIDRSDIANYKQISKTTFDDVLNQHIKEAQFEDLRPLLGDKLYNDIIANTSSYDDLLNGGVYTDSQNITRTNQGVKAVLVYYTDARYKMFGSIIDTPFSLVEKLNGSESKPVDYQVKKSLYTMNRQMAYNLWLTVDTYLRSINNALYIGNCGVLNNKNRSFKIRKIQ